MPDQVQYLSQRLKDELEAFHSSSSDAAEQCHRHLAHAYSQRLVELSRQEEALAAQMPAGVEGPGAARFRGGHFH